MASEYIDPEILRKAGDLAQTAQEEWQTIALTLAVTGGLTATWWMASRIREARNAKLGSAQNRYGAGNDYKAYLTFTDYIPQTEGSGKVVRVEQHTAPDFMWGNPQKPLSEIFGDHAGTSYFIKQFRKSRDAADRKWSNVSGRMVLPWRYRNIKDKVLVLDRMRQLNPKEFETLWPAMKDPWDIFFRGYIKENEIKKRSAAVLAENEEIYGTSVTYYPCLVDEPGANYRQGRIILVSKEQVEAGPEALPDPENIWVYNGESFVKGMDFYENGQRHNKMERYHTMRQLIALLQEPYWRQQLGLTVPGFRVREKEKNPESALWVPKNHDEIWIPKDPNCP